MSLTLLIPMATTLRLQVNNRNKDFVFLALCQMMLVKRNLRIIWTEQKEENLFLFCLFG
ncbi:Uncharacterised protein [Enterococcus faecium]|nr:hypothetical protein EFAU085_01642 [Enterococcus faecium Aus0085]ELB78208.1 hypothetical protein OM7_03603 [Enterococcus faecium EnGen0046]EOG15192.1 hypothetical protein SM5_01649 [Enterococcus faecium EnGen0177]EOG20346.1 hypothetical protein SMC_00944 [Enterococcus faecium EnGen0179]SMI94204.1 Uncharacterised protein [Enterococcus faecium]